jgi:hypothetical protein
MDRGQRTMDNGQINNERWTIYNNKGQRTIRGEEHEYFMDRQYEYFSVGDSNYHGFLSPHTSECINPLDKKRMTCLQREQWNSGMVNYLNHV